MVLENRLSSLMKTIELRKDLNTTLTWRDDV